MFLRKAALPAPEARNGLWLCSQDFLWSSRFLAWGPACPLCVPRPCRVPIPSSLLPWGPVPYRLGKEHCSSRWWGSLDWGLGSGLTLPLPPTQHHLSKSLPLTWPETEGVRPKRCPRLPPITPLPLPLLSSNPNTAFLWKPYLISPPSWSHGT